MEQLPLKDIHLPAAVSNWPPAPGWIAVAVLLPILVYLLYKLYRRLTQKSVLKVANSLLHALKQDHSPDALQTLAALSAWLRRVAISVAPRTDVASLNGAAWLAYLDTGLADAPFSQGIGKAFAANQYQRTVPEELDLEALFALCERWLKQQKLPQRN